MDAMCRTFGIDPAELPEACAHHLGRSRMELVTGWCDRGGESPMETLMRLMVRKIMTGTGRVFSSQMVVHADGTVSAPVHGGATGDSRIVARLDLGWHVVRVTKGHLDDAAAFRTVLRDAVGLCERRLAAREDG